ncbi:MAG: LysE family transporter [Anaerolineae bacterium]|nr:LysE family transporter [Anaerolineae bacterium]
MFGLMLQGLTLGVSAAATPGPFQAYLIAQSAKKGWRRSIPIAFAPIISDGPIIVLVLFILSQVAEVFLQIVQLAGGAFILYLAWGAIKSYRQANSEIIEQPDQADQSLIKAALMNSLSPGPWLYWSLITGPILIAGWRQSPGHGIAFLGGFYCAIIAANALLIVLFAKASEFGPKVGKTLVGLSGLALLGFGIYQLGAGVLSLVY